MTYIKLFYKNAIWVLKNAKFYADFEFVENVKKFLLKKLFKEHTKRHEKVCLRIQFFILKGLGAFTFSKKVKIAYSTVHTLCSTQALSLSFFPVNI